MSTSFRLTAQALVASFLVMSLGACNTLHGVGKDTEKVGEKIQDEVDRGRDPEDRGNDQARAVITESADARARASLREIHLTEKV